MARLSESELLALIESREQQSYGFADGELSSQRAEAIDRFLVQPYGDEQDGRSQVVANDTQSTVLWVLPQLLRIFLGGDDVARFNPQGPEDQQAADIESDFISHILSERNNAFVEFSAFLQDALLLGNGYAKVWWHADNDVSVERYQGKTDDELALLMQDADVEVIEHDEYPDPSWVAPQQPQIDPQTGQPLPPQPQPNLHDVVVRRVRPVEYARYAAVPPEEIYIDKACRSSCLQESAFVQHRRRLTLSELREMGYDVPDDISAWYDENSDSLEDDARNRFDEDTFDDDDSGINDPASRRVWYRESFLRVDYNGDGKTELRKVCSVARKILHNEEVEFIPIVSFAAIPFAHRHHALGIWDITKQVDRTKTSVIRQYLDGLRVQNNPRTAVNDLNVNLDDMLTSRPNGLVRVRGVPMENIMPMPATPVGQAAMEGLQWLDQWRQDSTGVSPYFMGGAGLDSAALNKTATGTSSLISQAQMRVEAIARSIADGVRELVQLLHALTLKHATRAEKIKLKNQWVLVDPRSWVARRDLSIQVALGSGTKEMRVAQLQQLIGVQMQLAPLGVVKPENLYASAAKLANELGYRNAEEFVSNPAMQPPPPPPPPDPLVQAQQIKSQADAQIAQFRAQAEQQKAQQDMALKAQQMQAEVQQAAQEAQVKLQMEQAKLEAEVRAQIAIAEINAKAEIEKAIAVEQIRSQGKVSELQTLGKGDEQIAAIGQAIQALQATINSMAQEMARRASGRVVRDQRGRVAGTVDAQGNPISVIERDANGRVAGLKPAAGIQ